MKLKITLKVLLALFACAFCPPLWAEGEYSRLPTVYGEVGIGLAGGYKSTGPAFTMRGVRKLGMYDLSLGYLNLYGMKAEGLRSDGASLPTINIEAQRVFIVQQGVELSLGGGVGFTMPNLASGYNEHADNGMSFTAIGSFTKPLSPHYALSLSIRGFFFGTDSQLTTYGSHIETLSTGQDVEVLDVFHQDNRLDFNSVLFLVTLRMG